MRKHISIINMAKMSRDNSDRMLIENMGEPSTPIITPQNNRNGTIFNLIMS